MNSNYFLLFFLIGPLTLLQQRCIVITLSCSPILPVSKITYSTLADRICFFGHVEFDEDTTFNTIVTEAASINIIF
jgi:hypothetical protein